ncbi:hypothetical protein A4X06_0g6169 [Tilletia controversa]|uniref:HTH APSES-type domain-containing protein n=1 Tax=Tilletia controversa TaxID=13291 RepID=A0A8X7SV28_9BASI|nr:hypothetical protein CF328_g5243 [Tilletia controversa]KAE8243653.1 hypothetical protein A4X06_0g6169 [Tilletia controversa]
MPAVRFDMTYPQREGFTRQIIKDIDIWAYTMPLPEGESQYGPPMTRRVDNDYVNATRLLQLTRLNPSQRARELAVQPTIIIRGGLNNIQGTWVPLERAKELAKRYEIEQILEPILFDPDQAPKDFVDERQHPQHTAPKRKLPATPTTPATPATDAAAPTPRVASTPAPSGRRTGPTAGRSSEPGARAKGKAAVAAAAQALASSTAKSAPSSPAARQSDTKLGKRKFGAMDSTGPSPFPAPADGRPQQVEIASWTARSQGGDSGPQATWLSRSGSGSVPSGSSNGDASIAKTAAIGTDLKQGLDAAERLRPRSPTLSQLQSMLQSNKRRESSPGLRSTAASNSARSSLRGTADTAGLPRENDRSTAGPSSAFPKTGSSSSWSADIGSYSTFSGSNPSVLNGGPSHPSHSSSSSSTLSVHDPTTWDSKYVAAFGRSRGWNEQRVLSKLRDSDIDGTLLLSLDLNQQSVFVLDRCGITVPGDQMRIIQAAQFLREIYPTGPEHRLFGQAPNA